MSVSADGSDAISDCPIVLNISSEDSSGEAIQKEGRKRTRNRKTWKKEIITKKRNSGQAYTTLNGRKVETKSFR
jgi:hypothetical protein